MNALLVTQIEKMAEQKLADYQLPGLALGVVTEEGLLWFGGFGKQNLGRVDSPTEDSLARVASVTKTYTTTAILQLRDESLLNLDDPLM